MSSNNTLIRSLHDVGVAVWCGGSLMGAVGLNGAAGDVSDPSDRLKVAATGWARWSPVAAAAIGAHLVGGAGLVLANRGRVAHQEGVTANTAVKTALTVAAMATTAYSGVLGARLAHVGSDQPVESGAVPSSSTPDEVAKLQQQQRVLQWATPVLTAALIVLGAQQGEQQKADSVVSGVARKTASRIGIR